MIELIPSPYKVIIFTDSSNMLHCSSPTSRRLNAMPIDDTIRIGLKLILCIDNIDTLITDQEQLLIPIIDAIDNIKIMTSTVNRRRIITRSFSCNAQAHHGSTYATRSPLEALINELMNLKLCLSHSRSVNIYSRLTGYFDEIIKRSNIEYDISMAYLFKVMLKETLVKGKHKIITTSIDKLYDNQSNETIYHYTWRDKFIVICYVLGHMPYINGALIRSRSCNRYNCGSADLITALNHPRKLLTDYTAHDIAIDSINVRDDCI